MSEKPTLGQIIDSMGVRPTQLEGDLVADVVVIVRVVEADGDERVSTAWNEGQSWVTRRGLLSAALSFDAATDTR